MKAADLARRVELLNCAFDPLTFDEAVERAINLVRDGERGHISTVNVAILMMMEEDPWLQSFVDRAQLIVADGEPLIWLSRAVGTPLPERVTGVDLVEAISKRAAEENLSVYFLGAEPGVAAQLGGQLAGRYPSLVVAGAADGYFSETEAAARANAIRASGAKILFVGMGVPRQERFLEKHWDALGIQLAVPVGGSFDVLVGLRRRAPSWMQRAGMEWAFRLSQEPERLWKRYLVTNTRFLLNAAPLIAKRRNRQRP